MAIPQLTTILQTLTGGGSGGDYDAINSPTYTAGLLIQNRSAADFFIGDADPATVFSTVKSGTTREIGGDGTPRKLRLFLGGTAGNIIEITALDERG